MFIMMNTDEYKEKKEERSKVMNKNKNKNKERKKEKCMAHNQSINGMNKRYGKKGKHKKVNKL